MDTPDITRTSAAELHNRYLNHSAEPAKVLDAFFEHADTVDPALNSLSERLEESATQEAAASRIRWEAGSPRSVLDGVPVTVKESVDVASLVSRFGTTAYAARPAATADAPLVTRLRAAGAIVAARTTAPDMNMGINGVSSLYGVVRNPWDLTAGPGGSSAGASASLAAGLGVAAVGTDLAGSVRIPAARCGLVALKPTQGRIAHPPASTVRSPGAMARTVADVVALHTVIGQPHRSDNTSLPTETAAWNNGRTDVTGLQIGLLTDIGSGATPASEVVEACEAVATWLTAAGAHVRRVPRPFDVDPMEALDRTFQVRAYTDRMNTPAEHRDNMLAHLISWSDRAEAYSAADYLRDLNYVAAAQARLADALDDFTYVISPVVPTARVEADEAARDLENPWADTGFTAWFNQTGQPAASVCVGFADRLPIGIQIIGKRFDDLGVLSLAAWIEKTRPFTIDWPTVPRP
ncbi:amidase family protein [Rhodococcus rhodochrous]|uniref:amidase family protein n=1 Tax=Rhodococcus rhodochrous TaxID=1829 RepID=UPI000E71CD77